MTQDGYESTSGLLNALPRRARSRALIRLLLSVCGAVAACAAFTVIAFARLPNAAPTLSSAGLVVEHRRVAGATHEWMYSGIEQAPEAFGALDTGNDPSQGWASHFWAVARTRVGWPMTAFVGYSEYDGSWAGTYRIAVDAERLKSDFYPKLLAEIDTSFVDAPVLPLEVRPHAIAVNIAVWTPIVYAIGVGCFAIRSAFRRARQRCTGCGYSLNGLRDGRCPECGLPREVRRDKAPASQAATG